MSGYLFAVLTGIFFGLQGTYSKILTGRIPPLIMTWGIFTFTVPYLFGLLLIFGIPPVQWSDFWWATAVSFLINTIAWFLFFRALQESSLAHTMPFTSFTPLFLIPVAFVLLGEMPDRKGLVGIFLIIAGGYGIHLTSKSLLLPFKSLVVNKGTRYMLVVALLWSISATVEKVAVLSSSQVFYGLVINLLLSLAYLPYLLWNPAAGGSMTRSGSCRILGGPPAGRKDKLTTVRKNICGLFVLGLISGLLLVFQFTALKYLLVSYVISFKRAGVIVSVILGIVLFREERPVKNLFATLLMVIGVFLIMV